MKHKILYLPCFVYAISFGAILALYQIGWSDLYPEINGFLLFFLLSTIGISFGLALFQNRQIKIVKSDVNLSSNFLKRAMYFLGIGYILEFLYESSIPLVSTLLSGSYSYGDFNGIPTFHVILGTFNIFFSILMFNHYLTNKTKTTLFQFVMTLIPYVLVLNRGAFMIVFSAMIFLFLMKLKSISLVKIVKPFLVLGIVLYFFGVIGNVRQEQTKEDKEYLLKVAGATDRFLTSGVPGEFYWSYIYLISPMGNLQNLINLKDSSFNIDNIGIFSTTQLFPDFISKRLVGLLGYTDRLENGGGSEYLVTALLNATTVYYAGYYLLGSSGLIFMFFAMMISALIYPLLIKRDSQYYLTAIASLNSIILLSTFNNMWYATGTILLWPIIFSLIGRLKLR
ncbi:O-antigen polymerase [Pedobacter sp. D749]|uniref:O-antigen polymerase n=1 Tax=Pedobacter sp. D749 TaxID=2856523 RepID=UPI001C5A485F|nr:O-antigen polymerase [Pedobacter sp. D749]QXU41677.1 oligosaccharide repeat unit polymerase [Pedobacter sp. D749]